MSKSGHPIAILMMLVMLAVTALMPAVTTPAFAQTSGVSGLPLPRFASLRANEINVRVGPGQRFDVAWVYVQSGLPVEIIQEYDNWRKIRDHEGAEGWIHKNLLSGERTALVAPWARDTRESLKARPDAAAAARAFVGPMVLVRLRKCESGWCDVSGSYTPQGSAQKNFGGWIEQDKLWGVYPDEEID